MTRLRWGKSRLLVNKFRGTTLFGNTRKLNSSISQRAVSEYFTFSIRNSHIKGATNTSNRSQLVKLVN